MRRFAFLAGVSFAVVACKRIDLPPRPQAASPDASFVYDAAALDAGPPPVCDDVGADFSLKANPSGPWSYGYELQLGAFTPLGTAQAFGAAQVWVVSPTGSPEPGVGYNPSSQTANWFQTFDVPPHAVVLLPGLDGESAVVRWTSPVTGLVALGGTFVGPGTKPPATADVHVFHGSASLFDGEINLGDASGNDAPFGLAEPVSAGDTVDFVVGWGGGSPSSHAAQLIATVCHRP